MSEFTKVSTASSITFEDAEISNPIEEDTNYYIFAHGKTITKVPSAEPELFDLNHLKNHITIALYCLKGDVSAFTPQFITNFCDRVDIAPVDTVSNDKTHCSIAYNMEFTSDKWLNDLFICEDNKKKSLLEALKITIPAAGSREFIPLTVVLSKLYVYHYTSFKKETRMKLHIFSCRPIDCQPIRVCYLYRCLSEDNRDYDNIAKSIAIEQNGNSLLKPFICINDIERKHTDIASVHKTPDNNVSVVGEISRIGSDLLPQHSHVISMSELHQHHSPRFRKKKTKKIKSTSGKETENDKGW